MTIQEFIEKNGISLDFQKVPKNPNMKDSDNMNHFYITLKRGDASMFTYYSMGVGHIIDRRKPDPDGLMFNGKRYRQVSTPFGMKATSPEGILNQMNNRDGGAWQRYYFAHPDAESVLDCLASDAATVENARRFEEWAEELGYDPDSREAEKTFDVCVDAAKQLEDFLGRDAYNTLLWDIERL